MNNKKTPVDAGASPEGVTTEAPHYQNSSTLSTDPGAPDQRSGRGSLDRCEPGRDEGAHFSYVRISVPDDEQPTHHTVSICSHGTVIKEGGRIITKKPQTGGKRGVVKEWSAQSRTRLRQLLAVSEGPEGWEPMGFTGTVPGDVIDEAKWRLLWKAFRKQIPSIPIIWRVELQQRKQPHIHLVTWIPPGQAGGMAKAQLLIAWWSAVQSLGPITWTGKDGIEYTGGRMAKPGADKYAVAIDELTQTDDFGWWRYLAAHAGKRKQAQMGWRGRAWGVLNPDILKKNEGEKYGLTQRQWWRMRRWLRRLTTYRGAGSGRKSVWYVNPLTMRDMINLTRSLAPS